MTCHFSGIEHPIGRRAFLQRAGLVLLGSAATSGWSAESGTPLRIGLITDLHYADKEAAGTRYYRETLGKLASAGAEFASEPPAFLVELGDLIDAADGVDVELGYLKRINREFASLCKDRWYVLGNHCVDLLTKEEFLGGVEQEKSYTSFDRGGWHFVILDACFSSNGKPYGRKMSSWKDANIPPAEMEWLEADLKAAKRPTIVFAHQRLDVSNDHGVKNCPEVRKLLEQSGNVQAVFQGHSHKNDYKEIAGIHYCTLRAMVEGSGPENSGASLLTLREDGAMMLKGFRQQSSYDWPRG
ncbi:3',5'-cyclic adenosine monophosphate phosphodiesterase CpdA [Caulifigura coniformis]|uniref:3',5'-cyclic adenosine monophosphate phosphodiesterase CpdA n=1 Tax=Caulifigura coniformis TaxID=2527983 RepID=A0A517SBE9_9PLAN|nr:metallophosphoesterase [Caulifigura coniformis]QDT53460.1 3',5'-cyclic adenosine monophosphate phosphodiesterase CpdA [Caulifigura coniformis]